MKFLVLKEEGIGNALLATPMITALRRKFPDAKIDVLASERNYPVFIGNPDINIVHMYDNEWSIDGLYDYGIYTEFSTGLFFEFAIDYCKKMIRCKKEFDIRSEPDHNLKMIIDEFDIDATKCDPESLPMVLNISEADFDWADSMAFCLPDNFIIIHQRCYNPKNVWRNRFWPVYRWRDLSKCILDEFGCALVSVGGADERGPCDDLLRWNISGHHTFDLVQQTTIHQTAALMGHAKMVISIDSGAMHLAAAMGTPQIALFGPTSEIKSPLWRADKKWRIIRDEELECKRCYTEHREKFWKCETGQCMKNITVDQVMKAVEELW